MPIRIVIGEETFLMREALRSVAAELDGIELVGVYGDCESLLEAIDRQQPNAVLTATGMPPTGTDKVIQMARRLRLTHPHTGVAVLSELIDAGSVLALFEFGSSGRAYLATAGVSDAGQLAGAIRAVADGRSVVDPMVIDVLLGARNGGASDRLPELTSREKNVLAELAQGKSNPAIAESLALSKGAVEKNINAIFTKLDLPGADRVSPRVKAALLFLASEETKTRRQSGQLSDSSPQPPRRCTTVS